VAGGFARRSLGAASAQRREWKERRLAHRGPRTRVRRDGTPGRRRAASGPGADPDPHLFRLRTCFPTGPPAAPRLRVRQTHPASRGPTVVCRPREVIAHDRAACAHPRERNLCALRADPPRRRTPCAHAARVSRRSARDLRAMSAWRVASSGAALRPAAAVSHGARRPPDRSPAAPSAPSARRPIRRRSARRAMPSTGPCPPRHKLPPGERHPPLPASRGCRLRRAAATPDGSLARPLLKSQSVGGFITERDFDAAEREFPGIQRLYESLVRKPRTFLELVWQWERRRRSERADAVCSEECAG
jgi:hypothetical protein